MKLESKECVEALINYHAKNKMEEMAVKVLTTKSEDVYLIPGIFEMPDKQMDKLAMVIKEIRNNIGIED